MSLPLYEYKCLKCDRHTDKIEPVAGPHLKKCPHCGGKVESVITAPAIKFKGSGWYVNDYAAKTASGESKKPDGSSSDKDSKDSKEASSKDSSKESAKDSGKDSSTKDKDSAPKSSSNKEASSKESSSKDSKDKKSTSKKD